MSAARLGFYSLQLGSTAGNQELQPEEMRAMLDEQAEVEYLAQGILRDAMDLVGPLNYYRSIIDTYDAAVTVSASALVLQAWRQGSDLSHGLIEEVTRILELVRLEEEAVQEFSMHHLELVKVRLETCKDAAEAVSEFLQRELAVPPYELENYVGTLPYPEFNP